MAEKCKRNRQAVCRRKNRPKIPTRKAAWDLIPVEGGVTWKSRLIALFTEGIDNVLGRDEKRSFVHIFLFIAR